MSIRMSGALIRRTVVYGALLIGLTVSQCVCQNNRPDDKAGEPQTNPAEAVPVTETKPAAKTTRPEVVTLPSALDAKDLDNDERKVVADVLREQYDPCGSPKSFLEALGDADVCDDAKALGAYVIDLASKGMGKRQATQSLLKELSRRAKKSEFDLSQTPVFGNPDTAKHIVVEFTDFECPHCKLAAKPVKALVKKHNAVLYMKMMPLDHHQYAKSAALAALAAHTQGKFWEVYTALFERQDDVKRDGLPVIWGIVQDTGADMAKFDADLADPALTARLAFDLKEATDARVDGTPTFFVNGYMVDYENLEAALELPPKP